jgi:hypothetical protein
MAERRWAVIAGVAALVALGLTVLAMFNSAGPTWRDIYMVSLGVLLGIFSAASFSAWLWHGDRRTQAREGLEAIISRKVELIEALPTRAEALSKLWLDLANTRVEAATAAGNQLANGENALYAKRMGMPAESHISAAAMEASNVRHGYLTNQVGHQVSEIERLTLMTDEEYLAEQKHLRGLN